MQPPIKLVPVPSLDKCRGTTTIKYLDGAECNIMALSRGDLFFELIDVRKNVFMLDTALSPAASSPNRFRFNGRGAPRYSQMKRQILQSTYLFKILSHLRSQQKCDSPSPKSRSASWIKTTITRKCLEALKIRHRAKFQRCLIGTQERR